MKTEIKDGNLSIIVDDDSKSFLENIMFLEIKVNEGDSVSIGAELVSMESVKGTETIVSEFDGKIISVNTEVQNNPDVLKERPNEWILKVSLE